jgi:putative tryptophan/tyrosine transport system substrate-binding protein
MRRREFIALLGGAAAWPRAARAQQPAMTVIGFLDSSAATAQKLTAFYEGLKIEGFVRNQNIAVEYHSAQSDYSRLPALAADLVNRKVTVIAAAGVPAAQAAKAASTTIPIVFAVGSDPVQIRLVDSLNRPGGNITGITNMAVQPEQKQLEFLHELVPKASNFALLVNPTNPNAESQARDASAAASKMGIQVNILHASSEDDFDTVFSRLAELRAGGLAIANDGVFISASERLATLALRHAVPAIFQYGEFAAAGGLMSYGASVMETYHQVGVYSGMILKGGTAADLPVFQATNIELIINLRTAKSLGITFPPALLGRADQVIE